MKTYLKPVLSVTALVISPLAAQEAAKSPPPGVLKKVITLPAAVTSAQVHREKVVTTSSGARITIQLIDAPVLPPAPAPVAVARNPLTPEQRAAMRAAAPAATRWFSPYITVYPGGMSHVMWSAIDLGAGDSEYEAWVNLDLSPYEFFQDITAGQTRYVLMPLMLDHRWRTTPKRAVPAATEFKQPGELLLMKGDAQNAAAMAPLGAMLQRYKAKGPELIAAAAERRAELAAVAEWERLHPTPQAPVVIKVCPIDAAMLSTLTPAAPAK